MTMATANHLFPARRPRSLLCVLAAIRGARAIPTGGAPTVHVHAGGSLLHNPAASADAYKCEICMTAVQRREDYAPGSECYGLDWYHEVCAEILQSFVHWGRWVDVWLTEYGCLKTTPVGMAIAKPCPGHAVCSWLTSPLDREPFCAADHTYHSPHTTFRPPTQDAPPTPTDLPLDQRPRYGASVEQQHAEGQFSLPSQPVQPDETDDPEEGGDCSEQVKVVFDKALEGVEDGEIDKDAWVGLWANDNDKMNFDHFKGVIEEKTGSEAACTVENMKAFFEDDGDGELTKDELRNVFDTIDVDKSGKISKEEWSTWVDGRGGCAALVKKAFANKLGELKTQQMDVGQWKNLWDNPKGGSLTLEKFKDIIGSRTACTEAQMKVILPGAWAGEEAALDSKGLETLFKDIDKEETKSLSVPMFTRWVDEKDQLATVEEAAAQSGDCAGEVKDYLAKEFEEGDRRRSSKKEISDKEWYELWKPAIDQTEDGATLTFETFSKKIKGQKSQTACKPENMKSLFGVGVDEEFVSADALKAAFDAQSKKGDGKIHNPAEALANWVEEKLGKAKAE